MPPSGESPASNLTIGMLAGEAGCTVPTVRYYEEIGLLPEASRREGGHRVYSKADVSRLNFIRRCRDFGFSIEQVKEFLTLVEAPDRDCVAARDLAQVHLDEVRRKLKQLRALERSLKQLVDDCSAQCVGGASGDCVILEDFGAKSCCSSGRA
jgi:MerR family transcriptional regulator, copper efflux regulator